MRVLALDRAGRLLLVRHSYGPPVWMPPGGGLRRSEDPVVAGMRELREETGCILLQARLLALRPQDLHGSNDAVRTVAGQVDGGAVPDGREIVAAQFFPLDALPEEVLRSHRSALPLWVDSYWSAIGAGSQGASKQES
nr:NUDIX domain-containing protein [Novosphingobium sp. AP12]